MQTYCVLLVLRSTTVVYKGLNPVIEFQLDMLRTW
jgi:hypothetical protein